MRKLTLALLAAAGLAGVAGAAAAPALAEVRFGINIGPPAYAPPPPPYYSPYGAPDPYYAPYYGPNPSPGFNIYVNPDRYSDRRYRHDYHGYYGR